MSGATKLRVGIPKPGGELIEHAKAKGYPILLSANAIARDAPSRDVTSAWRAAEPHPRMTQEQKKRWSREPPPRDFRGWQHKLGQLDGMDVALDSAGFVAWAKYGDFRWTVDAYIDLAARRDWSWWAQMDACVEDEVAGSTEVVRLRQAETVRLYGECLSAAHRRGIKPPMPVLQGRYPEDYIWCAHEMLSGSEMLIGVGSMCRRQLHGDDGLIAVIQALDAHLPAWTKLHLFGVKAEGIRALGMHPRVEWVDSMAWDEAAARCCSGIKGYKTGTPDSGCSWGKLGLDPNFSNTNAHRCEHMDRWVESVEAARMLAGGGDIPPKITGPSSTPPQIDEWVDLVMSGEIELQGALCHIQSGQ